MPLVPETLHRQVERYKRRAQRLTLAEGVAQTAAVFLGLVAITFMLDRWLFLPMTARVGLTLLVWGATIAGFVRFILRPLRKRWNDIQIAFNVEAAFPQLNEELETALELEASRDPDEIRGSPRLIEALVKDLAARASGLDFASVLSARRAQISGAVAAALALGLGCYAMLATEHFLLLAKRFINPLAMISKPSTVKLQVRPGNVTVESGSSVTVRVDVSGRRVGKAAVFFTADRQATMRLEVPASAATAPPEGEATRGAPPALQHFEIPLPGVRSNAVYFVRAGDAESPRFRIQAQRGPRLERFTLTYTYPAYTKLPPKTITAETADIAALAGTRVRVVGESSQPLSAGWLEINGAPPRALEVSDEHKIAAEITVDRDGEFKLRIADRMGFRNTDAVAYHIKALPDQPPTVKLLDPDQDLEVRANEPVNLKFAASDDYGVVSAYLVHNEHRDQMPVTGAAAFDLAKARYHVGDEVTFWIEVEDNSPARQIAKSEPRTLRISETADLSLRNKDFVELRKLREALARAHQDVLNARCGLDQLRTDSTGGWNGDLAARGAAVARELEAARDACAAAQTIVAGFIAKPRSPQALRDWENLDNLLKQLDEQLAAARDAAPELDRADTPAGAIRAALAKLADASGRPAGLVAQLDQGFFRLYSQQQIETLTQLARRIHRAELRVLDNVFGQSRYRRRVTDADEQADVVAAAKELTAGLGMADAAAADPQGAEAIRAARERLLDVSQPKLEGFRRWLGHRRDWQPRESYEPLLESLRKTRDDLTKVEMAAAEAAHKVRGQFERGRLELSQRFHAAAQTPADQRRERITDLVARIDQQCEPHLASGAGDARWAADLLLVREDLQKLAATAGAQNIGPQLSQLGAQLNLFELQRDLRWQVRGLRDLEKRQQTVATALDQMPTWQRLRFGDLGDLERDARMDLAPLGDRLAVLADRVAPVDGEAARALREVRQQFESCGVLRKLDEAANATETVDKGTAVTRAREAQADITALRVALERLLKSRLQQADEARAQMQQRQPPAAERIERLARQQEELARKTAQAPPAATKEERQQQAREQEQLRADARATQRSLLVEAAQQREAESMRDLHDAALRVAEVEREPMAEAARELARGKRDPAVQQQQAAAEKLHRTAQQLAAARQQDQLAAQSEQVAAMAQQQEKLLNAAKTSPPHTLPQQAPTQRALASQAQALAQAMQHTAPNAAKSLPAAQQAMEQAAQAMQQANQKSATDSQRAALEKLQQAVAQMANAKQANAQAAQQARDQLRQAEQTLPNAQQMAGNYDWLKKLSEIAAQQTDVAQRAAANHPAQPLAQQQADVRQQMRDKLEQPAVKNQRLEQAMEKLRASAQAVAELSRKEDEMAQRINQLRSVGEARQKEIVRQAQNSAESLKKMTRRLPEQAGMLQQAAQAFQDAAEALKRGDNNGARERLDQAANDLGDVAKRLAEAPAPPASSSRAEKQREQREKQQARTLNALARQQAQLAGRIAELGNSPNEQLNQLAESQNQMSDDLRRVGQELDQTRSTLKELSPQVAKAIEGAPEAARDKIPDKMRQSAEQMRARDSLKAEQQTQAARNDLSQLAQQLFKAAEQSTEPPKTPQTIAQIMMEQAQVLPVPAGLASSALESAGRDMDRAKGEFDKGQTQSGHPPAAAAASTLQTLLESGAQAQQQMLQTALQQLAAEAAAEAQAQAQAEQGQESQSPESKQGSQVQDSKPGQVADLRLRGELADLDKLPAELKQGLMHGMRQKYPPEYEMLIKRYFEKLSKAQEK